MRTGKLVLSRLTWLRLKNAFQMFLQSEVGRKAVYLMLALFTLLLCINGLNVLNSFVGRYFMSAIEKRSMPGFLYYASLFAGVFGASTLVAALFRFVEERLGLLWREWLTRRVLHTYLADHVYYYLNVTGTITNPDQRIAEDIRAFTTTTLSFLLLLSSGTITAVAFSSLLWSISPSLFFVAVMYAALGSCLTIMLGRPLIELNYRQSDREANFRTELIQTREHAEGISFIQGEEQMRANLTLRLNDLVSNFRRIISVNRNLSFFTTGYNYMIQLIPTLLVAPLFIKGEADFGIITQSAMAFSTLLGAFSLVVTQFQSISSYASVIARLSELVEATENVGKDAAKSSIVFRDEDDRVAYENLTLRCEQHRERVLIHKLSVYLTRGLRVLITGPNDQAKSTLMRATAGLSIDGSGGIGRPPAQKLAFLTERPYLPSGTLHQLLTPNDGHRSVNDEDILAVLRSLGLESMITQYSGLHQAQNWEKELSLSEQQALAVARAVLRKPEFIFLEYLQTAFNAKMMTKVLDVLTQQHITFIVIGHVDDDRSNYDAVLELNEDGSWRWQTCHPPTASAPTLSPK